MPITFIKSEYKLRTTTDNKTKAVLVPRNSESELPIIAILGTNGYLVTTDDFPKVFHKKSFRHEREAKEFFERLPDESVTDDLRSAKILFGWGK